MYTPTTQPLYSGMTPDEQTAYIASVKEYVNTSLPQLIAAGRALSAEHIGKFREGLALLAAFPQYRMFAIRSYNIRSDYDQHIATMAHQYKMLVQHLSDLMTVRTPEGQRVVVLQQTQTLRRGRPTQAESEQRKREEQAAAKATAVAALTGATISTQDAAPIEERESDTSRRKKDEEPSLFAAAVQEELSVHSDFDPSDPSPIQTVTPNSSEATSPLPSLRDWMHILPENLASQVRDLRNVRAEMASESEKAKLILEQGGTIADMQQHTQRAKELDRQINDLYAEIDKFLAENYVMLTEVNPEWGKLAARHMKQTGEPLEKLCARLKPYAKKLSETEGWFDKTLDLCRQMDEARIKAETRDPEKEKEMHKMDAYIRRKDVKPSAKRLDTMRQYRAKLSEMGADADSLTAYDVFIAAVEKEVAAKTPNS